MGVLISDEKRNRKQYRGRSDELDYNDFGFAVMMLVYIFLVASKLLFWRRDED